ncbi:flotillin-1-like [Onthophagus taurus]|uniref:flotillin-1-like n=1 Tax=Onthophagus taurus TaxID=166361 RepID=UPI000C20E041|nr:flotillin-1-like [Onthophagus taurus]
MVFGFITCGPNEALVISGCCHSKPKLVAGGRSFVWGSFQQINSINLNTMTLQIETPRVYTSQGVPLSVTGIAQIRVHGQNKEMLYTACEQFLGKSQDEIKEIALATLEGHQRAIMGSMTVEEIYKDRKKFSENVFKVASSDLVNMGLTIVSYTIKDIWDDQDYLKSLGMARTSEVQRDAKIGECQAKSEAEIKRALATALQKEAEFSNQTKIEEAKRDFELKKAAYDREVQTKDAESELAFELRAAKLRQDIVSEQVQIKVVERTQQIAVAEQEIIRQEKDLDAKVRKPAEAEKYRLEKIAEANRKAMVLAAEAEAEKIKIVGEAQAAVIVNKSKAEADVMAKKAEAWREYKEAATVNMIMEVLPNVVKEVSGPLCETKKVTMVSSGNGEVGAAKLSGEVLNIVSTIPKIVKSMTGVDISRSVNEMKTIK